MIPDDDMVDLLNAPQLDCFNQPFLGTPGFPFFWTSGPQLSTALCFDDLETFQAMPGVVDDNLAPGEEFNYQVKLMELISASRIF